MSTTTLFILLFFALSLQALISIVQVKNYRKTLKELSGRGIVGVGHTKGIIRPGEIILVKYDPKTDRITDCRKMKGRTVFARFKPVEDYKSKSLSELREIALKLDSKKFKRRRKKHPYNPDELTKKKHALIQAIEAIDRRLKKSQSRINVVLNRSRADMA